MLLVSTPGDTRRDWLVAGMALERLLLTAAARGLVATFADQAVQDPRTRAEAAEVLGTASHPQVMLRIGRPLHEVPRTTRRRLQNLLD